MADQYGSFWDPSTLPSSTTSSVSYPWYATTTPALAVPEAYSPSATSSNMSTPGFDAEGSAASRSPLHTFGADLIQSFGPSEQKLNRDGQPAKRRGPKPDHKPAMTRRQELNRQAQRTHRQKKENYIRLLEEQNAQLKEISTEFRQERDAALAENRKLKEILRSNGIPYNDLNSTTGLSQSLGMAGAHMGAYTMSRPMQSSGRTPSIGLVPSMGHSEYPSEDSLLIQRQAAVLPQGHHQQPAHLQQSNMLGYDQLGTDYLLASGHGNRLQRSTQSSPSPADSYKLSHQQHTPRSTI